MWRGQLWARCPVIPFCAQHWQLQVSPIPSLLYIYIYKIIYIYIYTDLVFFFCNIEQSAQYNEEHITIIYLHFVQLTLQACYGRPLLLSRLHREVLVHCRCELVSGFKFDRRCFLLCGQVEKSSLRLFGKGCV